MDDTDVTYLKPAERGIGYVPQDGALFSRMTVEKQIAFALQLRKYSAEVTRDRVAELARLLRIEHLLHRTPHGVDGQDAVWAAPAWTPLPSRGRPRVR